MSPLAKLLSVGLAILLVSCLLTPQIYLGMQSLSGWPLFDWLSEFPFHRYFSRVLQVTTLVAVIPLLLWMRIWRPSELGLEKNSRALADGAAGFAGALVPGIILSAALIGAGAFRLRDEWELMPLFRIFLTAGFVSCLEEFLFRGVFLGLAMRAMGAWKAAVAVSLAFAAVHFLRPSRVADSGEVTWLSGFKQAFSFMSGLPDPWVLVFALATLFFAGLLLAWVTLRTRSLWLAIGIHAGWILGQQGLNWLAKYRIKPPDEWLPWVGPSVVSGAVPTGFFSLLALAVTGLAVFAYLKSSRRNVGF